MGESKLRAVVVGGAGFGVAAALELRQRSWQVRIVERGPEPRLDASSIDISKMVRADYGTDAFYTGWMVDALEGWREWNESWPDPLFHETGFAVISSERMRPGGFEFDSFQTLRERDFPLERLDARALSRRLPAWTFAPASDGYINPVGGWVDSGRVVAQLSRRAIDRGIGFSFDTEVTDVMDQGGRVTGVRLGSGEVIKADAVVVAAGAWTANLIPELKPMLNVVGQGVFHFTPTDVSRWQAPAFLPWAVDIATTGWYGFCAHPEGTVKIANHGPGFPLDPNGPRAFPDVLEVNLRAFLRARLPSLAAEPIAAKRLCLYCDTMDGDFIIDGHPDRPGLFVATGGSGHGFKFLPLLGSWVADVVEGEAPKARFAWDRASIAQGARDPARCTE